MNEILHEPAGYAHLIERYALATPRPRHLSFIRTDSGPRRPRVTGFVVDETFPAKYRPKPKDDDFEQLEFALKYDGTDLTVLAQLMTRLDPELIAARIRAQPSSKYGRRIFFFYEWLTGVRLPLPDLHGVTYCPALDPDDYFVSEGVPSIRHRVIDNLLGVRGFCPIARRTPALEAWRSRDLPARARAISASVSPGMLARAISWLYTKETRSTFAIEHEEPGDREQRFVQQLSSIARARLDDEAELVALQHEIVQPPYRENGYRHAGDLEVYVGEAARSRTTVHHVGARSELTPELMRAWSAMRPAVGNGAAVIDAACSSFAFVFIHPFGDGNGRIHRLLLHNRLARRGYFPNDLVVPVSAVLVRRANHYDLVLEDFSRRVMSCTRYELDDEGKLTILAAPDDAYRYPDLTPQCEATFEWLQLALDEDLVGELDYLRLYDEIRAAVRRVLEMPDRKEQLFIKLCWDNRGRLAKGKRRLFAELDDATIERLEAAVREALPDERLAT